MVLAASNTRWMFDVSIRRTWWYGHVTCRLLSRDLMPGSCHNVGVFVVLMPLQDAVTIQSREVMLHRSEGINFRTAQPWRSERGGLTCKRFRMQSFPALIVDGRARTQTLVKLCQAATDEHFRTSLSPMASSQAQSTAELQEICHDRDASEHFRTLHCTFVVKARWWEAGQHLRRLPR